jgi:hypothetical protein
MSSINRTSLTVIIKGSDSMNHHTVHVMIVMLLASLLAGGQGQAKEGISLLTPQEAEALRATMSKTPVVPAELLTATDEELWDYIPPATLKRAVFLGPTDVGCPIHGKEIFEVGGGFYPWKYSADKPWQVQCPVGGETYPSNDFGAFYKSGMKDRSLLTGDYPDDGNGWVDEQGRRFYFVGHWVFWQRWYDVLKGITGFSNAYFASGNEEYARQATIMFCALAAQYPLMDHPNQSCNNDSGMILPWCWENQSVVTPMVTAYDRLYTYLKNDGDTELHEFIKAKTSRSPLQQIQQGFMQTVAKTQLTTDMYWSNEADHQLAFADWALAWDNNDPADGLTTRQAIEWLINDGGDNSLEELILNCTYRDGFPCEGAIGYSAAVAQRLLAIGDRLKRAGYDIFVQYPRLKQIATCWIDMSLANGQGPSLGDSGSVLGGMRTWNAELFHLGWENYRDPRLAEALTLIKSNRAHPYSPDRSDEFAQVLQEQGPTINHRTRNLGGMGLAILESGNTQNTRGLALYYGCPAGGHAHHDRLNIEYFDHRQAMMPDLGYPDQWGEKAQHFTQNSIGHYVVLVDEQGETDYMAGYLDFIRGSEEIQVVSARAERSFPGISLYRRDTAMIDLSAEMGYLFDVFRVRGGQQHDWSFHLPPVPEWGVENLQLSDPAPGTLAGADIPQGGPWEPKNGFNWLLNPQRGRPEGNFTFYSAASAPYPALRMTLLEGCADEVIIADHESPRLKISLPPHMKWLLARRQGAENLSSAFAAVIEACPEAPRLQQIKRLATTGGTEPVAVSVTSATATDLLLCDETGEHPVQLPGGEVIQGRWGMVRRDEQGAISQAMLIGGSQIKAEGLQLSMQPEWRGKITAVDYQANTFDVDVALPAGTSLQGEWVILSNGRHQTCYEIASVQPQGEGSRVQLTEISPLTGKGSVTRLEEEQRTLHTDTRWRIFGKGDIWSHDFGPALEGYCLLNEDLSAGVEIESCKLMPSRTRWFWKAEPAWIKASGTENLGDIFKDINGDGEVGWWIYDFAPGFDFRLTNSLHLKRQGSQLWSLNHLGGPLQVSLPSTTPLTRMLVRDQQGQGHELVCRYDAAGQMAHFTLPANLTGALHLVLKSPEGLNLDDHQPPQVITLKVDGKDVDEGQLQQLVTPRPPRLIEISARDNLNPLDPVNSFVQVDQRLMAAGEPGITLKLDPANPRQGVLQLEPEKFMDFSRLDEGSIYTFKVGLNDAALSGPPTRLAFRFILSPPPPEGSVYLSDLDPLHEAAHPRVIRDQAYDGGELWVGGVFYPKGLMVCPKVTAGPVNYGEAIYALPPGKFKHFRAVIGISDGTSAGSVIFHVQLRQKQGEWRDAYKSSLMLRASRPQAIAVELGDADEIRLYTDADGDISCDHAVYAGARLEP